jgi:hypothetical protein
MKETPYEILEELEDYLLKKGSKTVIVEKLPERSTAIGNSSSDPFEDHAPISVSTMPTRATGIRTIVSKAKGRSSSSVSELGKKFEYDKETKNFRHK